METLPTEVLAQILLYLDASDRLTTARTSRRWAQLISEDFMLRDVRLCVFGTISEESENVWTRTQRQYSSVSIGEIPKRKWHSAWLEYRRPTRRLERLNLEFWEKTGANLQVVSFCLCPELISIDLLHDILRHCPRLESLETTVSGISSRLLELPPGAGLEEIIQPSHSLRRLILPGADPVIGERLLNHLLELMPNLLYLTADIASSARLLSSLNHKFVELNFDRSDVGDPVVTQFLEKSSNSLQKLNLNQCSFLTGMTWRAISKCSKLRHLNVDNVRSFRGEHLRDILLNAVHLEHLDLSFLIVRDFTFEGIDPIPELKSLRRLRAVGYLRNFDGILKLLERTSNLHLLVITVSDELVRDFHRMASLKNLRTLILDTRFTFSTPECFAIISDNLRQLERLHLGAIPELTDVDAEKFRLLEHLKDLEFAFAERLSDEAYKRGFGPSALERLEIECSPLTNAALAGIAARHARLKRLILSDCDEITDDGLKNFLRGEPYLEDITLRGCCKLTEESLSAIESSCPVLDRILIIGHRLSKGGISRLRNQRPLVEILEEREETLHRQ